MKLISQYRGLKKEFYVLFIGRLVTAMGSFVWPMMTFLMTVKLGLSDSLATLLIAISGLLSLPAAIIGGKLADHFSRKSIIIVFDCLTVSLYVLAFFLPISYFTLGAVFLAGLFQTMESPAYDALNSDFSTTEQRERAFSLSYLGFNLGYVVGASVSGLLFENHTNLAFLLNGLSIFTSTVLIMLFVHMKNAVVNTEEKEEAYSEYEQPVDEKQSVLSVLKDRKVVLFVMLIGCIASMPMNLCGILLPLQLKETMGGGLGAEIYGYLNSLNGFVVILFTPLLTLTLRKLTELPKSAIGMALFMLGMVLFAFEWAVWVLFVGMFIYTVGEVVSVLGENPYSSRRIPASHRGRIGGITMVIQSVFSTVTQLIISGILYLTESNYMLIWLAFISIGLVAGVLYLLAYRPDKKRFPKLYSSSDGR